MSIDVNTLKGKVCIVTGGAGSIGFAVAQRYAQCGGKVFLVDRSEKVADFAQQICQEGGQAYGVALDLTNQQEVAEAYGKIIAQHGPVYALVNAAGVGAVGPFEETTAQEWEKVLSINVLGTVYSIQAAIGSMREQKAGRIINLSSKAGRMGSKLMTVYGASKGAIITLTQALAQEYAQYGVHVNCLCPDIIAGTGIWENTVRVNYARDYNISEEEVQRIYEAKVPLGHFATLEDIADITLFYTISGNDCTGQSLNVTGGRCMF